MNELTEQQVNSIIGIDYTSNDDVINEIAASDKVGRLAVRQNIDHFQSVLQEIAGSERGEAQELNDNGLKEYFVEGAYVRELFIPKGTFIVSKIWNKERMWIIATGEVTFTTEMGTQRIRAPFTKIVPLGSKVAIYAHEDTLWFAITGAKSTNSEDVENEVSTMDYNDCKYPWDDIGEST